MNICESAIIDIERTDFDNKVRVSALIKVRVMHEHKVHFATTRSERIELFEKSLATILKLAQSMVYEETETLLRELENVPLPPSAQAAYDALRTTMDPKRVFEEVNKRTQW